jgi:P27 family predicted phage terminase small subunit
LKLLKGTYRPDRDGPAADALQATGTPALPEYLRGEPLAVWKVVVPDLVAQGVAGAWDTAALVSMCEWWGVYRRNMDALEKAEVGLKTAKVLLAAASEASRQFQALAGRFGLTPSDRARLRVAPPKQASIPSRVRD